MDYKLKRISSAGIAEAVATRARERHGHHRTTDAPQVSPPPHAFNTMMSLSWIFPSRTASSRAIGIDAADVLPNRRLDVHLDARRLRVPKGAVAKARHIEVGTGLTVEPGKYVQIELRGDAGRVVVGSVQYPAALPAIHAEQGDQPVGVFPPASSRASASTPTSGSAVWIAATR